MSPPEIQVVLVILHLLVIANLLLVWRLDRKVDAKVSPAESGGHDGTGI